MTNERLGKLLDYYERTKRPNVRLAILEGFAAGVDSVKARPALNVEGCGDNSCVIPDKRGGMRTNGGCRCDERMLRRAVLALRAEPLPDHLQGCLGVPMA